MRSIIKSITPGKYYGFIRNPDGAPDIFFRLRWRSQNFHVQPGLLVDFNLVKNAQGQLTAREITPAEAVTDIAQYATDSRSAGVVKLYKEASGYGFILSCSGDVFVSSHNIRKDGTRPTLNPGEIVTFYLDSGPYGLWAKDVAIVFPATPPSDHSVRCFELPGIYTRLKAASPQRLLPDLKPEPPSPAPVTPVPPPHHAAPKPSLPALTYRELADLRGIGKKDGYPARKRRKDDKSGHA